MRRIRVRLRERSYDIVIGRGALKRCGAELTRLKAGNDAVIVTNGRIRAIYGKTVARSLERSGFSVRFETVPDSEKAKSLYTASRLLARLAAYDSGRRIFLVALGGGVVGDLAGFVAAIYRRGIPYVQVPTTLLAQVDSAIGGKTAIDLPDGKNLIGAFYQPRIVISDVSVTSTLPARQIRAGLAEVIKYGVIADPGLFRFVEKNLARLLGGDARALERVVAACSLIKASIVSRDEFDRKGERALLNYGHTIGHAIEAAGRYSGRYNHGEAVAVGMLAAADISRDLGLIGERPAARIEALIASAGLPTSAAGLSIQAVYRSHLHDKKFSGKTNRFVLPLGIGDAAVRPDVPDSAIRSALKERILRKR
jgi:3-dehydroquinate synthase